MSRMDKILFPRISQDTAGGWWTVQRDKCCVSTYCVKGTCRRVTQLCLRVRPDILVTLELSHEAIIRGYLDGKSLPREWE